MKTTQLNARSRTETGSRACRKLRAGGEIPASFYGATTVDGKTKNLTANLAVSAYDLQQVLDKHMTVLEVEFEGKQELVQLTEVQRDAFGDSVLHVDLRMIDANKLMTSNIGLVFKGEAKGTRAGGIVQVVMHALMIEALPRNTPLEIIVQIDDIDLNEALHLGELTLPEGVTAVGNASQVVVQVVPPAEEIEEEAEEGGAAPGAEPEVISKGKQEEDAS